MKKTVPVLFAAGVLSSGSVVAETCGQLGLSDEALRALLAAPAAARPVLLDLLQAQLKSTPEAKDSLTALLGTQLDRALLAREPARFRTTLAQELAPVCSLAALVAAPVAPGGDPAGGDSELSEAKMFESATRGAKAGETTTQLLDKLSEAGSVAFAGGSTRAVSPQRKRYDLADKDGNGEGEGDGDATALFADFEHHTFVHENLMRPEETGRVCRERDGTPRQSASPRCEAILNEVSSACPDLPESNSLRCSERLFRETSQRFAVIEATHERAKKISADAPQTQELARLRAHAEPLFQRAASVEANRVASYGLYAGPSFQLEDDGGWKGGTEILFKQQTEIFQPGRMQCPGFGGLSWCRGYFEASFTTPDEFPKEAESDSDVPVEVFDSKGRLRIEGGWIGHFNDWAGIEIGGGFASPLSDNSGFSRAEYRGKLGFHLQTLHNDGMLGQLSFGVLHDRSRVYLRGIDNPDTPEVEQPVPEESFDRFYLDATALFPKVELGGWRLAARLSGDWPIDGNEQADVRMSVLFYYPFNRWLETFKPTLKAATE